MICKICGLDSGKRNICKDCKDKYPFKASGKGGIPFNRRKLFEKDNKK